MTIRIIICIIAAGLFSTSASAHWGSWGNWDKNWSSWDKDYDWDWGDWDKKDWGKKDRSKKSKNKRNNKQSKKWCDWDYQTKCATDCGWGKKSDCKDGKKGKKGKRGKKGCKGDKGCKGKNCDPKAVPSPSAALAGLAVAGLLVSRRRTRQG